MDHNLVIPKLTPKLQVFPTYTRVQKLRVHYCSVIAIQRKFGKMDEQFYFIQAPGYLKFYNHFLNAQNAGKDMVHLS